MNRQKAFLLVLLFIVFLPWVGAAVGQNTPPAPATQVRAFDTPNDAGGSITITWKKSADDGQGENDVVGYEILRSTASGSGYQKVASVLAGEEGYTDGTVEDNVAYYYVVRAVDGQFSTDSVETGPAMAKAQWFNTDRTSMLVAVLIFSGLDRISSSSTLPRTDRNVVMEIWRVASMKSITWTTASVGFITRK